MVRESEPERSGRESAELSGFQRELLERGTHFKLENRHWAMFCLGIGQCGAQVVAMLNKKPEGLPSRHPDYYPVLCAIFDTYSDTENLQRKKLWEGKPRVPFYLVPPLSPTEIQRRLAGLDNSSAAPSRLTPDQIRSHLERAQGAGGVHILGRMYFQAFMEGGSDGLPIKQYVDDLQFGEQVGSIGRIGLLTVNSIRGGSGSGGAPFIAEFVSKYLGKSPSFSLNVSILPTQEERITKPLYAAHALASLFHMQNEYVDGVILVDNQVLQDRFGGYRPYQKNYVIHEMLAPFFYCPLMERTADIAPAVMDPHDIHNAIRLRTDHTSLCTVGFSKRVWSDGAIADKKEVLKQLAWEAVDNTSAKCKFYRDRETTFIAMLTAPPSFYHGISGFNLPDTLSGYLREAIEHKGGITLLIRASQMGARIGGQVGVLHQEAATSVQLSVIFSPVQCDDLDALVKDALGESRYNKLEEEEGWACLRALAAKEVEEIAREELIQEIQR